MLKLVCLFLSIAISITANADQCSESSCVLSADAPVVDVANANQPKEVIVHKIKKDIYPLPTCNDEALIKAIRNYVDEFYRNEKLIKLFLIKYSRRRASTFDCFSLR